MYVNGKCQQATRKKTKTTKIKNKLAHHTHSHMHIFIYKPAYSHMSWVFARKPHTLAPKNFTQSHQQPLNFCIHKTTYTSPRTLNKQRHLIAVEFTQLCTTLMTAIWARIGRERKREDGATCASTRPTCYLTLHFSLDSLAPLLQPADLQSKHNTNIHKKCKIVFRLFWF